MTSVLTADSSGTKSMRRSRSSSCSRHSGAQHGTRGQQGRQRGAGGGNMWVAGQHRRLAAGEAWPPADCVACRASCACRRLLCCHAATASAKGIPLSGAAVLRRRRPRGAASWLLYVPPPMLTAACAASGRSAGCASAYATWLQAGRHSLPPCQPSRPALHCSRPRRMRHAGPARLLHVPSAALFF